MSESPKKSPRQRFREEHAQFLERLPAGLTDLEIMRQMAWNKLQLKRLPDGLAGRHAGGYS